MQSNAAVSSEFPSVIADSELEPSPFAAAMFHLRQGLAALGDLSPGKDPQKIQALEELVALQKQVLQLLHVNFSPAPTGDERNFGSVLSQHREAAGLTQTQLADFTGLSLSLIRRLEQGDIKPSRKALLGLCSVPELRLVPTEVTALPEVPPHGHRSASNWYISKSSAGIRYSNNRCPMPTNAGLGGPFGVTVKMRKACHSRGGSTRIGRWKGAMCA